MQAKYISAKPNLVFQEGSVAKLMPIFFERNQDRKPPKLIQGTAICRNLTSTE